MNIRTLLWKNIIVLSVITLVFGWAAVKPVLAGQVPSGSNPENDYAAVDRYVEAQRKALNIPGAALVIITSLPDLPLIGLHSKANESA